MKSRSTISALWCMTALALASIACDLRSTCSLCAFAADDESPVDVEIRALLRQVWAGNWDEQLRACEAIAAFGPRCLPHVVRLLDTSFTIEGNTAIRILALLGPAALPEIRAQYTRLTVRERQGVLWGVGTMTPRVSVDDLLEFLGERGVDGRPESDVVLRVLRVRRPASPEALRTLRVAADSTLLAKDVRALLGIALSVQDPAGVEGDRLIAAGVRDGSAARREGLEGLLWYKDFMHTLWEMGLPAGPEAVRALSEHLGDDDSGGSLLGPRADAVDRIGMGAVVAMVLVRSGVPPAPPTPGPAPSPYGETLRALATWAPSATTVACPLSEDAIRTSAVDVRCVHAYIVARRACRGTDASVDDLYRCFEDPATDVQHVATWVHVPVGDALRGRLSSTLSATEVPPLILRGAMSIVAQMAADDRAHYEEILAAVRAAGRADRVAMVEGWATYRADYRRRTPHALVGRR